MQRMSASQQYPLKLCLTKYELDINVYDLKNYCFQLFVLYNKKVSWVILLQENIQELSELNHFELRKKTLTPSLLIRDKGFMDTVVNIAFA